MIAFRKDSITLNFLLLFNNQLTDHVIFESPFFIESIINDAKHLKCQPGLRVTGLCAGILGRLFYEKNTWRRKSGIEATRGLFPKVDSRQRSTKLVSKNRRYLLQDTGKSQQNSGQSPTCPPKIHITVLPRKKSLPLCINSLPHQPTNHPNIAVHCLHCLCRSQSTSYLLSLFLSLSHS